MGKLTKSIQKVKSNPKKRYNHIEGKGFVFRLGEGKNEVCLCEGKGKAFLYSILAGLSYQGLKRRYSRYGYESGKTKPLDSHLSPIGERPGSPLDVQKPSKNGRKIPEISPLSLTTMTMFLKFE